MDKLDFTDTACCFNSLSDIVASINSEWKHRWNMDDPGFCFRGADRSTFDLNPSLLRQPYPVLPSELAKLENMLWVEFRLRSKPLLGHHVSSAWEALLTMQQYGFPTRLLDWSRSLAVAAYFSIRNVEDNENGAIWIMAARHLMETRGVQGAWRTVVGDPTIEALSLRDGNSNFSEFMKQTPIPLSPDQTVSRMFTQRGIYTLHSFERDALESLAIADKEQNGKACFLHKILIPSHIKELLRSEVCLVAGVSEETIFPDIEGFARDFVNQYKRKRK